MHDLEQTEQNSETVGYVEVVETPQISVDVTDTGISITLVDDFNLEDVRKILESVRDLLCTYIQMRDEEKKLDNHSSDTDNTERSSASESDQPERG